MKYWDYERPNFKTSNVAIYYLENCYCLPYEYQEGQHKAFRITGVCFGNGVVFLHRGSLWYAYGNDDEKVLGTFEKIGG